MAGNDKFCCFRVHTIGMVLGWIGTIGSLIGIVILGFVLGNINKITQDIMEQENIKDFEAAKYAIMTIVVIGLVLISVNLVSSVLLILGTVKDKHLLILPWLINSGCSIAFSIINFGMATYAYVHSGSYNVPSIIIAFVIAFGFQILAWLAIHKLFVTIRNGTDRINEHLLARGPTAPSYTRL